MSGSDHRTKLSEFFSTYPVIHYEKGETIIRSEDQPQGVYFLKKGYVKMNTVLPEGKDLTLNIFKPGTYFPMTWAIADCKNTYSFQAIEKTNLHRAPKEAVVKFLLSDNEALYDLTRRILLGIEGFLFNMEFLLTGSALHRVIAVFCLLAKRCSAANHTTHIPITIPLTHQDIANLAGVARETASITIKELVNRELVVRSHGRFSIPDIGRLEEEISFSKRQARSSEAV